MEKQYPDRDALITVSLSVVISVIAVFSVTNILFPTPINFPLSVSSVIEPVQTTMANNDR